MDIWEFTAEFAADYEAKRVKELGARGQEVLVSTSKSAMRCWWSDSGFSSARAVWVDMLIMVGRRVGRVVFV